MNPYRKFKTRAKRRNNPQFGTHMYYGAHRYVYYVDGRPMYYFSDRPYTIEDAKRWKKGCAIWLGLASVLFSAFSFTSYPGTSDITMFLLYIALIGVTLFFIVRFLQILPLHPEEDPMLQSFRCSSDLEKPREETCRICGGMFSSGAHEVCPHCKSELYTS